MNDETRFLLEYLLKMTAAKGEAYTFSYMRKKLLRHRYRDYHVVNGKLVLDKSILIYHNLSFFLDNYVLKIYTNDECQLYKTAAAAAAEMRFAMNLKGRDFLKLLDYTPEEITYLLDLAADLKDKKKKGIPVDKYRGMNVALIFEKTSTRTRCAFEVAAHDMGMGTTYLDPTGSQIGKKESIEDTA